MTDVTDTTDWKAEAERLRAECDELSEQAAFAERHLGVISGVLGSPEPIEIDDIAARLHLLITERDAALDKLAQAREVLRDARDALIVAECPQPDPGEPRDAGCPVCAALIRIDAAMAAKGE